MGPGFQLVLAMSVPTLAVLLGILLNNNRFHDLNNRFHDLNGRMGELNNRINDLRADIDKRFEAMEKLFSERLLRVEQVLGAGLTNIEQNLHLR